jgi:hypothetical protein
MKCKPSASDHLKYRVAYGEGGILNLIEGRYELLDGVKLAQNNVRKLRVLQT